MSSGARRIDRPRWLTARSAPLAGGLGLAFAVLAVMQIVSHVLIRPGAGPPWFLMSGIVWGVLACCHGASWRWLRAHPGAALPLGERDS